MKYLAISGVMASMFLIGVWQHSKAVQAPTDNKPQISQVQGQEPAHIVLPAIAIEQVVDSNKVSMPESVFNTLPTSLRGAPLPVSLDVGQSGVLIINDKIKKLFDYYLSAVGEEPLTMIVARIKHQLKTQLDSPAIEQALSLLSSYLNYRNQLAALIKQRKLEGSRSVEQMSLAMQQMADLRIQLFEAEVVDIFFGEQQQYDQYMLAKLRLAQDQHLSTEQHVQAKEMLDANMPQWLKAQQDKADKLNQYRDQAEQLINKGQMNEAQLLAQQTFGIAAADRLEQLRQKREQWQSTLNRYHEHLQVLLSHSMVDELSRNESIEQLRSQYFLPAQIKRVAAIDGAKFNI